MHYYESEEESEARFEAELERLKNQPSFLSYYEKWFEEPTAIGAKYLWLEYTKAGLQVPDDVVTELVRVIEAEIKHYKDGGVRKRSIPGTLNKDKEEKRPIYHLLHLAKENPECFWRVLHPFSEDYENYFFPTELIERVKARFPEKRELSSEELYEYFGELIIDLKDKDEEVELGDRMKSRYRTFKKNLKKNEEL